MPCKRHLVLNLSLKAATVAIILAQASAARLLIGHRRIL